MASPFTLYTTVSIEVKQIKNKSVIQKFESMMIQHMENGYIYINKYKVACR